MKIVDIKARQIFDSRGNPTVEADIFLENGIKATASVPSGASTGSREACELRDGDSSVLFGKGVLKAVKNIEKHIKPELIGKNVLNQAEIDQLMVDLDGTDNKKQFGANAILAVSLAIAKAASKTSNMSLYRYIGGITGNLLPVPLMNIINGGKHADNTLDIQEFMIVPAKGDTFANSLQMGSEVFHTLKEILAKKHFNTNVGDEGGFAPNIESTVEAIDLLMIAIDKAGYKAGEDILIAMDVAASELYDQKTGKYILRGESKTLSTDEMVDMYYDLIKTYPIFSIEDPLAEYDKEGFALLNKSIGDYVQIVGDDLFVTNPYIFQDSLHQKMANAILIKPNQVGTVSETLMTIDIANANGYSSILSHRSGETEDISLVHLAVGTKAGQIKTGSMSRTDRIAKYNELLRIEEELGSEAVFAGSNILKKYAKYRKNLIQSC